MAEHADPARFDFVSRWQLSADRVSVWDALIDFQSWPDWWPGLTSVEETAPGNEEGIGQRAISTWRAPVGYSIDVEIESVERRKPEFLKGVATGEVEGSGQWTLSEVPSSGAGPNPAQVWTQINFEWLVVANKKWMEMLDPVARPLFVFSHEYVMKHGAEGLAGHLGCDMRDFAAGR